MIIIQLSTVTEFDVERATRMVIIFLKKNILWIKSVFPAVYQISPFL